MWIRPGADRGLDAELEAAVRSWVASDEWPDLRGGAIFPGRDGPSGPSADRGACWAFFETRPLSAAAAARVAADAAAVVLHRASSSGLMP